MRINTKETPIIFKNQEELNEFNRLKMTDHLAIKYFPAMVQNNGDREMHTSEFNTLDTLSTVVYRSVMWSDIRDDYLPKKWYELQENKGKFIMVRDDPNHVWAIHRFKVKDRGGKFHTTSGACWNYARPLTPEDYELVGEV